MKENDIFAKIYGHFTETVISDIRIIFYIICDRLVKLNLPLNNTRIREITHKIFDKCVKYMSEILESSLFVHLCICLSVLGSVPMLKYYDALEHMINIEYYGEECYNLLG